MGPDGSPGQGDKRHCGAECFGALAPDTYGVLGIRHEDTVAVTESGCENLAPKWSGTPEEPTVV